MFKRMKMSRRLTAIAMALAMLLSVAAWGETAAFAETGESQSDLPAKESTPAGHSTDVIRERGVLTVAVSKDNSRVNYVIPDNTKKYGDLAGTRDGSVPELCRRIAEELGVKVEFVEYATTQEQLDAAAAGEVDIAVDNFRITKDRLALYEMTESFDIIGEETDNIYLSKRPVSGKKIRKEKDLENARIAVVKGTVQAKSTAIQYPKAELHELADNQAVLDAVASGEVDACVFSPFIQSFADKIVKEIQRGKVAQCNYKVKNVDYRGYGLILMKGNTELCQYLNTLIYHLMESGWMLTCCKTEEIESVERGIITKSSKIYQNIKEKKVDCPSLDFTDLDTGKWYHQYVDYVLDHELMDSMGDETFSPDGSLTWKQAITALWRLENKSKSTRNQSFEKIAKSKLYTQVTEWVTSKKIVAGNGSSFSPDAPVTWEQLAALLYQYAAYKKYDVTAKGDLSVRTDGSKISDWAYAAMQWASGANILRNCSDGAISPAAGIKRCEFAAVVMRFAEDVAKW